MPWTWNAVWKVLQPQPKCSGMVYTLASGRISTNSHKFGEVSVVVRMWMWSHMPIHNLRMCSNLHIGMTCTYDAVWKVLQSQPKSSGMVWTLAKGKISANFPKSGEASVVATVWMWSHMPIHNLRRCSNTSFSMTWTWDAVWKVLQPQSKSRCMVCTRASGRISANSYKYGEVSVVVWMWMWSYMTIHNLRSA